MRNRDNKMNKAKEEEPYIIYIDFVISWEYKHNVDGTNKRFAVALC